jgi:hypothetical protein
VRFLRMARWRSQPLGFPPFVPAADIGVTDALNVDGCIRVDIARALNGFGLSWEYCAGSFRTRFSYRIISLVFALFDI